MQTLRVSAPGLVLLFLGQFVYGHFVLVPFEQGLTVYRITLHATVAGCALAIVMINVPLHRYFLANRSKAHKGVWSKLTPYILYLLHAVCWLVGTFVIVFVLCAGVLFAIGRMPPENADLWPMFTMPGVFLSCVLWFWHMLHFGLTLPAAAINHSLTIRESLHMTGLHWLKRLPVAIVLASVSFAQTLLWFTPTSLTVPLYAALATALIYLQALLWTSILSALYEILAPEHNQ